MALCCLMIGCRRDMYNQPKGKPLAENVFFKDEAIARPIPPHTVVRGDAREDSALSTGLTNGMLVAQLPIELTPELLARGRERYEIHCAVCHGLTGEGNGEIVKRGFPAPPTYHVDRLRNAPIGHFYDVITNGYGVMYPYATRVAPADRWAIAAYIRALQLSQNASPNDVSPNERSKLEATP
jgi:mono/diheme cytochrome c family protein